MVKQVLKNAGTRASIFIEQRRRYLGNKNHVRHMRAVLAEHGFSLSPADEQKCRAYASDILGHPKYQYWLQIYAIVQGAFKDGWIPDDYYFDHIIPHWNGESGKISYLKSASHAVLNAPILPDILIHLNGLFLTPAGDQVPEADVKAFVFQASDKVIFKVDSSIQGRGIYVADPERFDLATIKSMGNGVIQTFIRQHPDLDRFAPGNVSTLRMTTVRKADGSVERRGCCLRVGRTKSQFVKSTEQLVVPIDLNTGAFGPAAYDPFFIPSRSHPDTGIPFDGAVYPEFEAAKAAVIDLHRQLNLSRCVGWDVVVDTYGQVKLMEWNGYFNSLRGHEALQGPTMTGLGWERLWKETPSQQRQSSLF